MEQLSRIDRFQLLGLLFLLGGMLPLIKWISQQMKSPWTEGFTGANFFFGVVLFAAGLGLLVAWRWTRLFFRFFVIAVLLGLIIGFLLFSFGVIQWRPGHAAGSLVFSGAILFTLFVQGIRALAAPANTSASSSGSEEDEN